MKNYFSAVVTLVVPQEVTLFVIRILALHVNLIRVRSLIYAHKLEKNDALQATGGTDGTRGFFPRVPLVTREEVALCVTDPVGNRQVSFVATKRPGAPLPGFTTNRNEFRQTKFTDIH